MLSRIMGALQRRRNELGKNREGGFTLVELLVVVIIIGILAAIAIPVYLGIQDSAKDSAAQSDLANAKISVVAEYTKSGSYPAADATNNKLGDFTFSKDVNFVKFTSTATNTFCIQADSASGKHYKTTDSSGTAEGTC